MTRWALTDPDLAGALDDLEDRIDLVRADETEYLNFLCQYGGDSLPKFSPLPEEMSTFIRSILCHDVQGPLSPDALQAAVARSSTIPREIVVREVMRMISTRELIWDAREIRLPDLRDLRPS